jgi:hypothetical protein
MSIGNVVYLQHCWKAGEAELLEETFCGQAYNPVENPEHRGAETMEEANSRPVCAVCHRRAMHHYAKQLRQRETVWMHLERIIWRDRVTGEVRTEGDKVIEVVSMGGGDVLVQDVPSGTHRMIPRDNIVLATLEGKAS